MIHKKYWYAVFSSGGHHEATVSDVHPFSHWKQACEEGWSLTFFTEITMEEYCLGEEAGLAE